MAPLMNTEDDMANNRDYSTFTRTQLLIDSAIRITEDEDEEHEYEEPNFDLYKGPFHFGRKQLSFSCTVQEYAYIPLKDFSEREIRKCWYNDEEMAKMRSKVDKIVNRMEKGKPSKENITYRGLESYTQAGLKRLEQNVFQVVDSVMDEQDRQWEGKYNNVYRIAAFSRVASEKCQKMAELIAKEDEREAREAYGLEYECNTLPSSPSSSSLSSCLTTESVKEPLKLLAARKKHAKKTKRSFLAKALVL